MVQCHGLEERAVGQWQAWMMEQAQWRELPANGWETCRVRRPQGPGTMQTPAHTYPSLTATGVSISVFAPYGWGGDAFGDGDTCTQGDR